MIAGRKRKTSSTSAYDARGSNVRVQGTSATPTPSLAARRASSLPRFVTRTCSTPGSRASSRHSRRTWFWPPRHSRPESTWRTRSVSGRRLHVGEHAPQFVELERLLEEGAAEPLEELQRVAAYGVTGGEHHSPGDGGMHLGQRLIHLAPAQARHPEVADDQVEWLRQRALQRLAAIGGEDHDVAPALEGRLHIVEDVRLIVHDEDAEPLRGGTRGGRRRLRLHQLGRRRQAIR